MLAIYRRIFCGRVRASAWMGLISRYVRRAVPDPCGCTWVGVRGESTWPFSGRFQLGCMCVCVLCVCLLAFVQIENARRHTKEMNAQFLISYATLCITPAVELLALS